jgi:hypothetical protein
MSRVQNQTQTLDRVEVCSPPESFRRCDSRSDVFGANMLGAVAGGLAQNLSFIVGMRALLLIAALVCASAALLQTAKPFRRESVV